MYTLGMIVQGNMIYGKLDTPEDTQRFVQKVVEALADPEMKLLDDAAVTLSEEQVKALRQVIEVLSFANQERQ